MPFLSLLTSHIPLVHPFVHLLLKCMPWQLNIVASIVFLTLVTRRVVRMSGGMLRFFVMSIQPVGLPAPNEPLSGFTI